MMAHFISSFFKRVLIITVIGSTNCKSTSLRPPWRDTIIDSCHT